VLRALGVSDAPAFDSLVGALTRDVELPGPGDSRSVGDVMVSADEVVQRLRAFVEEEQRAASGRAGKALRLLQRGGDGGATPGAGGGGA
jgi:hypothetical protein